MTSGEAAPGGGNPWEQREEIGFWRGFLRTVGGMTAAPRATLAATRERGSLRDPLLFGLLTALLAFLVTELIETATGIAAGLGEGGHFEEVFALEIAGRSFTWLPVSLLTIGGLFLGLLIGIPAVLLLFSVVLFAWSGLLHLSLLAVRALRGSTASFQGTFRGVCFSQVGLLAGFVPEIGALLAMVWVVALQVAAFVRFHGTSRLRAAAGTLLPLAPLVALVLLALLGGD